MDESSRGELIYKLANLIERDAVYIAVSWTTVSYQHFYNFLYMGYQITKLITKFKKIMSSFWEQFVWLSIFVFI